MTMKRLEVKLEIENSSL